MICKECSTNIFAQKTKWYLNQNIYDIEKINIFEVESMAICDISRINKGMSFIILYSTVYRITLSILKVSINFIKHSIQHSRLENYKQLG